MMKELHGAAIFKGSERDRERERVRERERKRAREIEGGGD